jgi:hypothetical protein
MSRVGSARVLDRGVVTRASIWDLVVRRNPPYVQRMPPSQAESASGSQADSRVCLRTACAVKSPAPRGGWHSLHARVGSSEASPGKGLTDTYDRD